ncbi:MAG: DUF3365 domain-containing protein [Calditrichaeota bacterium]|nr:MAG: DUF3365 domain-containing protein [Calditrichota bacterium]MBL1204913.1 DUF3365 domain-containing protein [Calditrichota bacterium]NOG44742.1 DUF3365 domain-containing protein [Calditrichota bacterium]
MRWKLVITFLFVLNTFILWQCQSKNGQKEKLNAEALSITKKFGGTLKPQLKKALEAGGPINAIDVCSFEAPKIAMELSKETGWEIKRVSLKTRNAKLAKPDEWEKTILEQFKERQAKGESPEKMAFSEIVDGQFRFMKAQGVEAVCLTCHGETIAPEVKDTLKKYYPDDKATDYSLGQIRGAFSLSKKL